MGLATETGLASPKTFVLARALLAVLVVLDAAVRYRVPFALAGVHRW